MSNKNQTKAIRWREKDCDEELKTHTQNCILTQNSVFLKNTMIHQPKVKLQERINNRERE